MSHSNPPNSLDPISDPNITQLVSSNSNSLLGRPNIRDDISNVFSKLDSDSNRTESLLQYPLNLGTDDSHHFMLFKMYQGQSGYETSTTRSMQYLTDLRDTNYATIGDDDAARTRFLQDIADGAYGDPDKLVVTTAGGAIDVKYRRSNNKIVKIETEITSLTGELIDHQAAKAEAEAKELEGLDDAKYTSYRWKQGTMDAYDSIALYIPHKLNVAGMNTYDTPEFGTLRDIEGLLARETDAAKSVILKKMGAGSVDALAGIIGSDLNARRAVEAATGKVSNPRRETLFVSPEMRKFEFAFELAPRNQAESVALRKIIKKLKYHAYPSIHKGGYFFNMPAEFELEYYQVVNGAAQRNIWLNRIGRCVLQEVNVDYTASGSISMFHDGAPTHINMTLSFQELELITQEKIGQGY